MTVDADDRDPRLALGATGLLRDLNRAGVLTAADVHVATRLGRLGGEDDERVLLAAALAVRAARSGSVCLDLGAVADAEADTLSEPGTPSETAFPWPDPAGWRDAVAASPLLGRALAQHDGQLYLARYFGEESQVVDDLVTRSAAPLPVAADDPVLAAALREYFPDDAYADQRRAAETACRHWTSVVTGGPGTGKTTTVARLLGVLLSLTGRSDPAGAARPLRIALAAPTGKAAARMAQAVRAATAQEGYPGSGGAPGEPAYDRRAVVRDLEATTLHRLLGSRPDSRTRFRHHRGNRLPHDVVVVDETSMVSLTLMTRLLEAMRPEARLVLVGDSDQLASVEAGAVLKDLVDGLASGEGGPVSRLGPTRRFGRRIGALADAVREGDADAVLSELQRGLDPDGTGVLWLPADELPGLLGDRAEALWREAASGDHARALAQLGRHRMLCAHREGPYGVAHWNRATERLLMRALGEDWLPEWYVGRPLIVNANDYGLGLFNGDTGVVCRSADGGAVAAVEDGVTVEGRSMPTSRMADVSTAHALTVHRSQGSQFDEVTVLLPEGGSRILTRELLYTAVTRATRVVRLVGSEEAVRAAVGQRARRATGLARRLGGPAAGRPGA